MKTMLGIKPQIDLKQIRPTSKLSLKLSSLAACGNDIEQAERIYNFIAGDMEQLPEVDIQPPSPIEQFKNGANDLFNWIGQHRDSLIEGWNLLQSMRGGALIQTGAAEPPANIPPIPKP